MLHSNSVYVQRRFIAHVIKEKKELHNIDNKQWICFLHMQCAYGELPIEVGTTNCMHKHGGQHANGFAKMPRL